jgi:gas vesicle protein
MGAREFGWGLFSGAAIGLTLAVLFAPQSGEETREQLASAADDLRESATTVLNQARESINEATTKLEGALGLQERRIRRKMDELKAELAKYSEEASEA